MPLGSRGVLGVWRDNLWCQLGLGVRIGGKDAKKIVFN